MGFLVAGFAAFGQLDGDAWHQVLGELGSGGTSDDRRWSDETATVSLGLAGAGGALRQPHASANLAAVVDGFIDGERDIAAATLEAYRRGGVSGLASLRGDYAYVLWDPTVRHLIVGCDARGLRAPAFAWNGRTFLLSTRAVALLRHPEVRRAWDTAYLAHAFAGIWSGSPGATPFDGVRRLLGGELIRVSAGGIERLAGDRLRFGSASRLRGEEALRELGETLDRAVEERTGAARWGVALSGGVDSCLVATSLARVAPRFDAFSLVAPTSEGCDSGLSATVAAFQGIRHHLVPLPADAPRDLNLGMVFDDPICSGPILQPARLALVHAVRAAGVERLFDGEGGDEVFDLAWRPADLIRGFAVAPVLAGMGSATLRRRLISDFLWSGSGPASRFLFERARERLRMRRPWLRAQFWESRGLAAAWEEADSLARLRTARERLPGILSAHGRYWRAQETVRRLAGIDGASPLLDRRIIELVGSIHPGIAIDVSESKALLRRLAGRRVPAAVAHRPKREPLSDWLIQRWIALDANVAAMTERIRGSSVLNELVAPAGVAAAVQHARQIPGPNGLASSLVELAALVEWISAIETRFGL